MSENAIRGVMLSSNSFTAVGGTEVGGMYTSSLRIFDGQGPSD